MAESIEGQGGREPGRIDIGDDAQRTYWSRRFEVRAEELEAAVRAVGDKVEDVTRYIDQLKQGQNLSS